MKAKASLQWDPHLFYLKISVRPLIAYTNPQMETIVGRTVRLTCVILMGNPRPTITWLKVIYEKMKVKDQLR